MQVLSFCHVLFRVIRVYNLLYELKEVIMEEQFNNNLTAEDLENRTYRYLQQLAKSLHLPSNVKKVYLIELILAKNHKTEEEVNAIVQRVKDERKLSALRRPYNRYLQNKEITSTSIIKSPPITNTPTSRRPVHAVIRYSPDYNPSLFKYNPKYPLNTTIPSTVGHSDRVLRSYNLKSFRKSYSSINVCNAQAVNAIKVKNQATTPKDAVIQMVEKTERLCQATVVAKRLNMKHKPSILKEHPCFTVRKENLNTRLIARDKRPKRQRMLSGIYPLMPVEEPNSNVKQVQGVSFRRSDGTLSKINAVIHKRNVPLKPTNIERSEMTIQDLLNSTIDDNFNEDFTRNVEPYPNLSQVDDNRSYMVTAMYEENMDNSSKYYHKKIRSEQLRCQMVLGRETEGQLPAITDVFRQFNEEPVERVAEPLFVHVGDLSVTLPQYTAPPGWNVTGSNMLEGLYNFRNSLLINAPLMQLATTSNTTCVYSTPLIATAMAQHPTTLVPPAPFNVSPYEPNNQYRYSHDMEQPPLYKSMRYTENADLENSLNRVVDGEEVSGPISLDTTQSQRSGSATIPEMVEDAMEIISQDGDYMEHIGMDVRVQCVLCSWAGPKFILEFHIRKEHPKEIHKSSKSEHKIIYSLGSLLQSPLWVNRVLEFDGELFVLSVKYESPDCLMTTLTTLSYMGQMERNGTITIYNKVSGEPYIWMGNIQALPSNLPYENDVTGQNVPLSKLNLLPNSANLMLHNEELVLKSPTKVVVGQPEFNDIHITIFVTIC